MGNAESSPDLRRWLLTSNKKRNNKQHEHSQHPSRFWSLSMATWSQHLSAQHHPQHLFLSYFFFLFSTGCFFWTPKLPLLLKRNPILKSKFPILNPALPHHTQSMLSSLKHCWANKVAHQREEQLNPAPTELAVASAPAAGEPARTEVQHRGRPTSACLHSFSGWGQRARTHPIQAFKPFWRRTQDLTRETERQIIRLCYAVRQWEGQAHKHWRKPGRRAEGVSSFILLICEVSLEQTDTGHGLFPVRCKNISPAKKTNVCGGTVRCFTAKQTKSKPSVDQITKESCAYRGWRPFTPGWCSYCQPKPQQRWCGVKQNCYRKKPAPAHPCCSRLQLCLSCPISPSTGAKSWVKKKIQLKNNLVESVISQPDKFCNPVHPIAAPVGCVKLKASQAPSLITPWATELWLFYLVANNCKRLPLLCWWLFFLLLFQPQFAGRPLSCGCWQIKELGGIMVLSNGEGFPQITHTASLQPGLRTRGET